VLPEKPVWTFKEAVGGVISIMIVGVICFSALMGSEASGTALVGAAGAVTGWLFRGSGQAPTNGNGNGNGSAGSAGSAGSGGGATTPSA
jgi:hypothetical protein